MLDEEACSATTHVAGIERKGTFIFHKSGQPVHGLHLVQIYQDAAVDDQKTAVIFQEFLKLGKDVRQRVFFLCIDHAVVGLART